MLAIFNLWAIARFGQRDMLLHGAWTMDQADNGGGNHQAHAAGSGTAMPAEFGALYQAGFEAGYAKGREDGYRMASREHARETPTNSTAKPAVPPPRRRGLLGLPCERCGTFLYSDETRCPHCKTQVTGP